MRYPIGYIATVFYYGEKTKFKYVGDCEWEFVSGENSPARYQQLLDMLSSDNPRRALAECVFLVLQEKANNE